MLCRSLLETTGNGQPGLDWSGHLQPGQSTADRPYRWQPGCGHQLSPCQSHMVHFPMPHFLYPENGNNNNVAGEGLLSLLKLL